MNCPDCGEVLKGVPLGLAGETDQSLRCYKCGGFWLNAWLANRVNSQVLAKFDVIKETVAGVGSGACPVDGAKLERFEGESVPGSVVTKRCPKCGWWWFGADNLFKFKPAQEAKVNYYKSWGITSSLTAMLLPVLSLVVLVGGAVVGVRLLQTRQVPVNAASVVSRVSLTYVGNGEAVVGFFSQIEVGAIEYRRIDDEEWFRVPVVKGFGGQYETRLTQLEEGMEYRVRIGERVYQLKAGR